ncbi:MAG: hypothetical protein PHQ28_04260 [Mycobacterium sp.]|nr:hypothetical protein [Mycobacterium sp.]
MADKDLVIDDIDDVDDVDDPWFRGGVCQILICGSPNFWIALQEYHTRRRKSSATALLTPASEG